MAPKQKAQKMALGAFLADESLGSWADEMDDVPTGSNVGGGGSSGYGSRRDYGSSSGGFGGFGGGPRDREDRYPIRESVPVPDKPPYTAHIGNLSFDITEAEISEFFANDVANVRLVRDKMEDRPKGFGYVEFHTREGLLAALELSGTQMSGRNVRVSVADPPKEGTFVMPTGNWARNGPLAPLDPPQRRERFGDRDRDMGERRQSSYGQDDGRVRDFNNWERKGPLSPMTPATPGGNDCESRPRSGEREFRRRVSPAPSAEGGPRGGFRERPPFERAPSAADQDNEWRRGARPDPQRSTPTSPVIPQTRPRLELKKRSEAPPENTVSTPGSDKPNPFGAAKPIDTSQREREIEERRTAAAAARREKEEKAREQRKAEREARGEKGSDAGTPTTKDFRALRRTSASTTGEAAEASGAQTPEEAAESPKEQEKKVEERKTNVPDTWRKAPPKEAPSTPKEEVDGDGWATVSSKRGRGGASGNRAAVPT